MTLSEAELSLLAVTYRQRRLRCNADLYTAFGYSLWPFPVRLTFFVSA